MRLEDQCVSLELAKQMKELGFKQESLYDWIADKINPIPHVLMHATGISSWGNVICSSYTVAELGDLLPGTLKNKYYRLYIIKNEMSGEWEVLYRPLAKITGCLCFRVANTLADAMATMLIYLKENDLLEEDK